MLRLTLTHEQAAAIVDALSMHCENVECDGPYEDSEEPEERREFQKYLLVKEIADQLQEAITTQTLGTLDS